MGCWPMAGTWTGRIRSMEKRHGSGSTHGSSCTPMILSHQRCAKPRSVMAQAKFLAVKHQCGANKSIQQHWMCAFGRAHARRRAAVEPQLYHRGCQCSGAKAVSTSLSAPRLYRRQCGSNMERLLLSSVRLSWERSAILVLCHLLSHRRRKYLLPRLFHRDGVFVLPAPAAAAQ